MVFLRLCQATLAAVLCLSLSSHSVFAENDYQLGVVAASATTNATSKRGSSSGFSWTLNTATSRTFKGTDKDPGDPLGSAHGSATLSVATNGILTMKGSTPRYYIKAPSAVFADVEMVAYGRLTDRKTNFNDHAGMTMVTRSNHGQFDRDPCQARGYYSRIYFNTGEFAFQKEFYHDQSKNDVIYSQSRRQKLFAGGFPKNKWVGMKFELRTNADQRSVSLKGYVDENESGAWRLAFETTDNGGWKSTKQVPATCKYAADEIMLRAGSNSYFRTDDVDAFEWKKMSVRVL